MTSSRKLPVKFIVAVAVVAVAASILVARGVFRPRATGVTPDERRETAQVAVVRIDQALRAHPRWGEFELLTTEVSGEAEQWDSYRNALQSAAQDGSDAASRVSGAVDSQLKSLTEEANRQFEEIRGSYQRKLSDREKEVWAAAQAKMDARKAVMAADIDQTIGIKRGQLKADMAKEVAGIKENYQARILSLRLKLESLSVGSEPNAEADRLRGELTKEQTAMDAEVAAKEKEYAGKFDAFVKDETTKAEAQLRQYGESVASESDKTLQAERERLEKSLQADLASAKEALAKSLDRNAAASDNSDEGPSKRVQALQLRRNDLQALMLADIKRAADVAAKRRGLSRVRIDSQVTAAGVDVTDDVVKILADGK